MSYFTPEMVTRIVTTPDLLADIMVTEDERQFLAEFGITPLVDRLLAAHVAGTGHDTLADDVHKGAVRVLMAAERAELVAKQQAILDGLE